MGNFSGTSSPGNTDKKETTTTRVGARAYQDNNVQLNTICWIVVIISSIIISMLIYKLISRGNYNRPQDYTWVKVDPSMIRDYQPVLQNVPQPVLQNVPQPVLQNVPQPIITDYGGLELI
jgi:hypothetical protein